MYELLGDGLRTFELSPSLPSLASIVPQRK